MPDALRKADEVLQQAVQGITDLINVPSLINLDFADVKTVMKDKGIAHIGIGTGHGDDKAMEAVKKAVESPLLETSINGASNVLINISGDVTLMDVNEAAEYVQGLATDNANIIFGSMYDENRTDEVTITVIATGLENPTFAGMSMISSKLKYAASEPTVSRPVSHAVNPSPSPAPASVTQPHARVASPAPAETQGDSGIKPMTASDILAGLKRPLPERTVAPKDIKVPDFLKK